MQIIHLIKDLHSECIKTSRIRLIIQFKMGKRINYKWSTIA